MAWYRVPGRLARLVGHLVRGIRTAGGFERLTPAERQRAIARWSRDVFGILGIEWQVHGAPAAGAALVVSNHVSWLDTAAVHAACPQARFVSKADVLRWPLVGRLIRSGGTLFIERERKRDALRVVHEVAAALQRGESVAVFPEGTTGPGDGVQPFHANLLQAAIATHTAVQPVALRYSAPGEAVSRSAQYIGDTTLVGSMLRLASARGVRVQVHFLPPIATAGAGLDRRALAERARAAIAERLDEIGRGGGA